ncbi:McrC family protein [Litchfieldella xinjiangensis]|uniref:McrC family protein n=1 Tax=Litchfieldella xinjiangensis TaxID=1166948 RepID=UPI000693DFA7|nr:McrC family protein [Halomonas xinjiangensis]
MTVQVREYATLTYDASQQPTMDLGIVSRATFDWLMDLQQRWKGQADLLSIEGKHRLRLCSYVGYLQSPNGEAIEILPKAEQRAPNAPERLRILLQTMLSASLGIKPREAEGAELMRSRLPLHEWVIRQFLDALMILVRRGLHFDYRQVEEQCRFVRGQLDMAKQIRQTPDKAGHFYVRHAEFSPQRLENRLIKTALAMVFKQTRDYENWRLANILSQQLADIEPLRRPLRDLDRWHDGKLMQRYQAIKPWCRLVLEQLNPDFQQGHHRGIALLFPMEQLFERYLKVCLQRHLVSGAELATQVSRRHLLRHAPDTADCSVEQKWFALKPDFLIQQQAETFLLDAKWKLLDQNRSSRDRKYELKQADLYQMFAYGHKYLNGNGHVMLVYPKHENFSQPLPVFRFDGKLSLWCVPIDLYTGKLVSGDWQAAFSCFQPFVAKASQSVISVHS